MLLILLAGFPPEIKTCYLWDTNDDLVYSIL
jgi:hypothetical protein